MAQFDSALAEVIRWEGYYSLDPHDPGGETYSGISRHFWPTWAGWGVIDRFKPLKWNTHVPALDIDVQEFYLHRFWFNEYLDFDILHSQVVADKIFQHYVNMGRRAIDIAVEAEGLTYRDMLATMLNKPYRGEDVFMPKYVEALSAYYIQLVANHPNLQRYLAGWLARAKAIPLSAKTPAP